MNKQDNFKTAGELAYQKQLDDYYTRERKQRKILIAKSIMLMTAVSVAFVIIAVGARVVGHELDTTISMIATWSMPLAIGSFFFGEQYRYRNGLDTFINWTRLT